MEHLDGNLSIVPDVACEIDGGHAALPDLAFDEIAIGEGDIEAFSGRSHAQSCARVWMVGKTRRSVSELR